MAWMAGGMLGAAALNYYGSQQQADTMAAANQPLPTYYQHYRTHSKQPYGEVLQVKVGFGLICKAV